MTELLGGVQGELGRHRVLDRTLDDLGPEPVLVVGQPLAGIGLVEQLEQLVMSIPMISRARVPMSCVPFYPPYSFSKNACISSRWPVRRCGRLRRQEMWSRDNHP